MKKKTTHSTPLPRLDILLYAHDGRGLGHISRTVAIGMALRRLYPDLRVLTVTGSSQTGELIHSSPLDWLKLPSYRTRVIDGKSRGIDGNSCFTDRELGLLRAETLQQIVDQYRPRAVLVDHSPQGKHRELLPALQESAKQDTRWILGVRGVVGAVPQVSSTFSLQLFQDHYTALLWYGDSQVLGPDHIKQLASRYNVEPIECGYVSRMEELNLAASRLVSEEQLAGTIAIPWLGEHSLQALSSITEAMEKIGPDRGRWLLFVDPVVQQHQQIATSLQKLPWCELLPPGPRYLDALSGSKTALIYGGYNSLTDVLAAGLPTVVLLRAMQDSEQQIHLKSLNKQAKGQLLSLDEQELTGKTVERALITQMGKRSCPTEINLQGAEYAAQQLVRLAGI